MLKYTKILHVNDIKPGNITDAGDDVYVPFFDEHFITVFLAKNPDLKYNKQGDFDEFTDNRNFVVMRHHENKLFIYRKVCIPTGLQIDIPEGYYYELRNRSSNFGNNFDVKTGIIDNDYTYGSGIQLSIIDKELMPVIIETGTRVAQLIALPLKKFKPEHQDFHSFETSETVKNKRQTRTGGFGSTGTK